jgi:antitoxin component YwqK of YwqJK toxin-antitoxin module
MPGSGDPDAGGLAPQTMLDGIAHGDWQWFRKDGTLMRSGSFDRGRQAGIWRTYERSGRLVKVTDFAKPRGRG